MSVRQPLPDHALVVLDHAGLNALGPMVLGGALDFGEYECPVCCGKGRMRHGRPHGGGSLCGTCCGHGTLCVRADGVVSRGSRRLK